MTAPTFSQIMAQAAIDMVASWDPATFTPAVGDAVSLNVNLSLETEFQPGGLNAQAWGSETTIEYRLADIGREADRDETFIVNGTTYTVQDVDKNDGIFVTVNVT